MCIDFVLDKDLIQRLKSEAEKNCRIENVKIGDDRVVKIAPLQITNAIQENKDEYDFHHRAKRAKLFSKPPVGDVEVEQLFVKANEFAERESSKKDFGNPKEKEHFIKVYSNVVGIPGQAGCGKSTLAKTILSSVVGEKDLYGVDSIFYLEFRDINYNDKTNLLKFLSPTLTTDWMTDKNRRDVVLQKIQDSNKVLIIMDGLDEANIDFTKNHHKVSISDETTAEIFIMNILQGTILENAKKLVFSRQRQMLELPDRFRPHFCVNILGLDEESQMQICEDICGENKDQVFNYIKNHSEILSFSYIPITCILSCYAINKTLSREESIVPQSMTGILTFVLGLFVNSPNHRGEFKARNIAELTWKAFKVKKFNFQNKDLTDSELSNDDINKLFVSVTKKQEFRLFGGNPQLMSYFSHLILQEFLVAVHLLVFSSLDEFEKLISNSNNPDCNLFSSRFEMVTKFLFGLCNQETFDKLKECIQSCEFCPKKWELLQNLPKDATYTTIDDEVVCYFNWAYELQNNDFTNRLAYHLSDEVDVEFRMLPSDFEAFYYVCNKKQQPITLNKLSEKNFYGKCWKEFVSDPRFSTSFTKDIFKKKSGLPKFASGGYGL